MRIKTILTASLGVFVLGATLAAAEGRVYPHHTSHNFCPAGLQPVTMDGVICCGTPNQSVSYQSMMAHAAPKKKHRKVHRARASHCPIGTKGCSYN